MATYTNRTCHSCGIRKPQPQMNQSIIYDEVGKSTTGVSAATWIGLGLGDKKSTRSVGSWLFNSGQRTYKRKKTVWLCDSCSPSSRRSSSPGKFSTFMYRMGAILVILAAIVGMMGGGQP